ncbi:hypothetical protein CMV53_03820 [Klebsiella pneumoniae]|nr:hypothetical protein CMV53_03820 [Klebsiella pneumoniae]
MSASTAEPEQVGLPVKWLYPLIPPLLTNPGEALLFEVKIIKNKKLKITSYTTLVVIEVLLRSNKPVRIDRYQFSPSFIALPSLQIQQCRFIREPSGSISGETR